MGFGSASNWDLFIGLLLIAVMLALCGAIAKKAGYSVWWTLVMLVPFANFIMIWVFAFSKWPVEQAKEKQ